MGSGLIPIVAYNYGAKKPKRIYQSCRWAMLYSVIFYSIFFLIMEVFPEWVLLLFDASLEMLSIGVTALRILAVSHLLSNVCLIYSAAFQGLGLGEHAAYVGQAGGLAGGIYCSLISFWKSGVDLAGICTGRQMLVW